MAVLARQDIAAPATTAVEGNRQLIMADVALRGVDSSIGALEVAGDKSTGSHINGLGDRIEAQSKYGRISSDIPTVRINDDERFASGVVGGGRGPTIQIRSQGDVLISGDAATAAEDHPTQ